MRASIKRALLVVTAILCVGLVACATQKKTETPAKLVVNLRYYAGTGYEWMNEAYTEEKDFPLECVNIETVNEAEQGIVGGSLVDVYTYEAVSTGNTRLTFALVRQWELPEGATLEDLAAMAPEDLPEGAIVITADVTVNDDGTILLTVEPSEYMDWFVIE